MLEAKMVIPCTIWSKTTDEYGDLRKTAGVSTVCWFRDIDSLDQAPNREADISHSMAWLQPTQSVSDGDYLTILDNDYRIITVTYAKRLGSSEVQFIKCQLNKLGATVS